MRILMLAIGLCSGFFGGSDYAEYIRSHPPSCTIYTPNIMGDNPSYDDPEYNDTPDDSPLPPIGEVLLDIHGSTKREIYEDASSSKMKRPRLEVLKGTEAEDDAQMIDISEVTSAVRAEDEALDLLDLKRSPRVRTEEREQDRLQREYDEERGLRVIPKCARLGSDNTLLCIDPRVSFIRAANFQDDGRSELRRLQGLTPEDEWRGFRKITIPLGDKSAPFCPDDPPPTFVQRPNLLPEDPRAAGFTPSSDSSSSCGSKISVVRGIEMFHKDKDPPRLPTASLPRLRTPEYDEPDEPMAVVNGIP